MSLFYLFYGPLWPGNIIPLTYYTFCSVSGNKTVRKSDVTHTVWTLFSCADFRTLTWRWRRRVFFYKMSLFKQCCRFCTGSQTGNHGGAGGELCRGADQLHAGWRWPQLCGRLWFESPAEAAPCGRLLRQHALHLWLGQPVRNHTQPTGTVLRYQRATVHLLYIPNHFLPKSIPIHKVCKN